MIVDQAEIESLKAQAAAPSSPMPPPAAPTPTPAAPTAAAPRVAAPTADAPRHVRRLLRIRVPAIVQLTATRMPIGALRKLSLGTILEFDKLVDDPLELLINNRAVARGETVKAGENFGLRITAIHPPAERIRSMGR